MNYKKYFYLLCLLLTPWVGDAKNTITNEIVHEIINECVSKTGGFIIKEETKENRDNEIQIALPQGFGHYEISKTLRPLMLEIEDFYYPFKPWKVIDNGYLCSINLAKDGSKRSLSFVYVPDNGILYINDSPGNTGNLTIPSSFIDKLQNTVVWGAVNSLDGFIREETQENISAIDVQTRVSIQLQKDMTPISVISGLKSLTTMLETAFYLARPWKQDDNGVLECEFFAKLEEEGKNMLIYFYYFPKSQVLTINFITGPAE